MKTCLASLYLSTALLAAAAAQEAPDMAPADMSPAKEVARFEPLIGNWVGEGKMKEPRGVETAWVAKMTYQWCLNKHFVQQDFEVRFEGLVTPMTFRNYLGWDREQRRYVSILASNEGHVRIHPVTFLPDGTMLQVKEQSQAGTPYAERAKTKVDGDSLSMIIDVLMAEGESLTMIDSNFRRADEAFEVDWGEDSWSDAVPHAQLKRVGAMRGMYAMEAEMIMVPGAPAVAVAGRDIITKVWNGNVIYQRTEGSAEGAPQPYESHSFWGWDQQARCVRVVFVDSMGQLGQMLARWVDDQLVTTGSRTIGGVPTTQRYILKFGRKGQLRSGVGHTVMGLMDPFVSFKSTYKRRG